MKDSAGIQQFESSEFGNLRIIEDGNGNPLFCAKAVRDHCAVKFRF